MEQLFKEELFIIEKLKENNENLNYRKLQDLCAEEFESVRLILKKLKEKIVLEFNLFFPRNHYKTLRFYISK